MGFGVAGIIGNSIAGRYVDVRPLGAAVAAIAISATFMSVFPFVLGNHVAAMVVLVVWGGAHAAGFVTNHVRTIRSSPPELQELAASLNVSIFNAGIGMGAVVGGKAIDAIGLRDIGVAGGRIGLSALVVAAVIAFPGRRLGAIDCPAPRRKASPNCAGCGL